MSCGDNTKKYDFLLNIGFTLNEAKVYLSIEDEQFIDYFKDYLKQLLIVSKVELNKGKYDIKVESFTGIKCERCWNLFDKDEMVNDICHRCHEVIKNN